MDNSGVVTSAAIRLDTQRFAKYTGGKNALVAQGGGQRGIFTSGVLDAFQLSNFDPFDTFYGTSAGALNLCAYLCRQRGLGRSFILELTTEPEFFNLFRYIRRKQYLGLDWALDKISEFPYKLDIDMGRRVLADRKAYAAVTDTRRLLDHYLPMLEDDWRKVLIATCAIPRLYHEAVEFEHGVYVDGGVSASIPVQEAWRKEARCIVVIRTEGEDLEEPGPLPLPEGERINWNRGSFQLIQEQWQERFAQWKIDWRTFFYEQLQRAKEEKISQQYIEPLNGGRWLFGADSIYRLGYLLGDRFDSSLADMLMVHYQTYALTQNFLHNPPDDCFIVQIKPDKPLLSNSLMSSRDALLHDYQVGLDSGFRFVEMFSSVSARRIPEGQ
ncbi:MULTISPECIES: patatin-like phospholipase family protein [Vibrio]|uniref:patatin-like phospholipase family protein n=1 Tax=Vibrio TaxID=662 RepID=UPI0020754CF7|nr:MULTISPECIES: patatin-like phospholipase family protein [Vibrio]USD33404.1 patatin-like phospholipase family protein [Vibrio sp. SCSIO 43186]USD46473.1 patatin-like phospholipase family protein [Vibrio sp. SCSIO 43145]USD70528.1 patatin-like phospholipase family protein [Vibrio sp. SCSIO 43139]USD95448.1 patatin family protein [Vibrio coralliilyticus]